MIHGSAYISLRPVRFAFLVPLADKKAIREAIQLSTFLWGGIYNPIVPVFKRLPKRWHGRWRRRSQGWRAIVQGYLDNYDPDIVVPMVELDSVRELVGERLRITPERILGDAERHGGSGCGTSIFDVMSHFCQRELIYVRRYPLQFESCFPRLSRANGLFLASVFGELPHEVASKFESRFQKILDASLPTVSIKNYSDYFRFGDKPKLFPRRMSSLEIRRPNGWSHGRHPAVLLLDASEPLDIIDYWNLRALSWDVMPLPLQAVGSDRLLEHVIEFLDQNTGDPPFDMPTILKSRMTNRRQLEECISWIRSGENGEKHKRQLGIQEWYPPVWDAGRAEPDARCKPAVSASKRQDLILVGDRFVFEPAVPPFRDRGGGFAPRYANDVDFRFYGSGRLLAEVIPEGPREIASALGAWEKIHWRFSSTGIVFLPEGYEKSHLLSPPDAEVVFKEWMRSQGWDVELSVPGRVARTIAGRLSAASWMYMLDDEAVIELLESFTGDKYRHRDDVWGNVQEIAGRRGRGASAEWLLDKLVEFGVLQLGVEIQCSSCQQHSWYSLEELDYTVQCGKCLDEFRVPARDPKAELKWAYKATGPFNNENKAHGAYGVLLTLRFFSRLMDASTTPIFSFNERGNDRGIEADLALFLSTSWATGHRENQKLVFAECKSRNRFKRKDVSRMRRMMREFPGSTIVFSSFNRGLTKGEINMIRPLAERGRNSRRGRRPINPVMVLTGEELFGDSGIPPSWRRLPEIMECMRGNRYSVQSWLALCDATQQLRLGMDPWQFSQGIDRLPGYRRRS